MNLDLGDDDFFGDQSEDDDDENFDSLGNEDKYTKHASLSDHETHAMRENFR